MNRKQKSILAGRKPKHREDKPVLSVCSVNQMHNMLKWVYVELLLNKARLRQFQLASFPIIKEVTKDRPNCTCTWEGAEPLEPTIVVPAPKERWEIPAFWTNPVSLVGTPVNDEQLMYAIKQQGK